MDRNNINQQLPLVQFSKLDQNNKAQFLQFLIKNNITFDHMPGKQNVLAKVTLKTIKPNKITSLNNTNNKTKKILNNPSNNINKSSKQHNKQNNQQQYSYQGKYSYQEKNKLNNKKQATIEGRQQKNRTPLKNKQLNMNQKSNSSNSITKININTSTSPFNKTKSSFKQSGRQIQNQRLSTKRTNNINQNKLNKQKQNTNKSPLTQKDKQNLNKNNNKQIMVKNKKNHNQFNNILIECQQIQNRDDTYQGIQNSERSRKTNNKSINKPNKSPIKQSISNVHKQSNLKLINFNKQNNIKIYQNNNKNYQNITKNYQNLKPRDYYQFNNSKSKQKLNNKLNLKLQTSPNNKLSPYKHQSHSTKNQSKINQSNSTNNQTSKQFIQKIKSLKLTSNNQNSINNQSTQNHKTSNSQLKQRIQLVNKYIKYFSHFFIKQNIKQNIKQTKQTRNNSFKITIKQRPVCWPLNQIQKFLDQFYDQNFIKNTHQILNGSKKLNQSLSKKNNNKTSHIAQFLLQFMNKKFNKVHKSIQYNLVNLLYSIAYHINQQKQQKPNKQYKSIQQNDSITGIKLFQSFITQQYSLEQYLFYLFCRNILKQDFKKSFIITISKSVINKKQIDKFLKHIIGHNNLQILQEYHKIIFQKISNYQIEIYQFLKILIEDYKIKRQAAEESYRQKMSNNLVNKNELNHIMRNKPKNDNNQDSNQFLNQQHSLQSTFNKILSIGHKNDCKWNLFQDSGQIIRQDSMEQLTFGQDTRQMLKQVDFQGKQLEIQQRSIQLQDDQQEQNGINYQFWQSPYINKNNQNTEKQKILKEELNQMIAQKLCQKTVQLVQILSFNGTTRFRNPLKQQNQNQIQNNNKLQVQQNPNEQQNSLNQQDNQNQQVQELLFSKALSLLFTVVQMNKVKWLKQLHISTPSQQDIQKVEEIQLFYRKIKQFPTAKDIAQFCKLILTVPQITQQLSKFFV